MAKLTFYGAAQEVTGSCYLLESPALGRLLLECGMHQGGDAVDRVGREQFEFKPNTIDGVIISHAHLDHSGMLPKLVHQGFTGPIYCTDATAELLEIMLDDAVGLYERDLERENLRRERSGRKLIKPEYERADVDKVLNQLETSPYNQSTGIGQQAQVCFHDAGHILGSAIVELTLTEKEKEQEQTKTLVFSGDLGNDDAVLMKDATTLQQADVVLMEGTYGNRNHRSIDNSAQQLENILAKTWQRGGNVMIPAFAVGRTQEILFHLGCLYHQGKLDNWQVFLDSPMAIEVTQVYNRWLSLLDSKDTQYIDQQKLSSLEAFLPVLHTTASTDESMAINRISKGAIIIAGSGMCTGGRIRHHFKHRIWQENNTVIFVGFQAKGTLGRMLIDGVKKYKMFGDDFFVRAQIETIGGLSAHAGQKELIAWVSHFTNKPRLFLIHGEVSALETLATKLLQEKSISAEIPHRGHRITF
ncbi:MAG: MBL fold metallo-hydrolase [Cellvibrionaceae bacterium]